MLTFANKNLRKKNKKYWKLFKCLPMLLVLSLSWLIKQTAQLFPCCKLYFENWNQRIFLILPLPITLRYLWPIKTSFSLRFLRIEDEIIATTKTEVQEWNENWLYLPACLPHLFLRGDGQECFLNTITLWQPATLSSSNPKCRKAANLVGTILKRMSGTLHNTFWQWLTVGIWVVT